jgi:hypothetical protein
MAGDVLLVLRAQHERLLRMAGAMTGGIVEPVDDLRRAVRDHVAAAGSEIAPLVDRVPGSSAVATWAHELQRVGAVAAAGGDEAVRDVTHRLVQLEEAFVVPALGRLLSPAERRRLGAAYLALLRQAVPLPPARAMQPPAEGPAEP